MVGSVDHLWVVRGGVRSEDVRAVQVDEFGGPERLEVVERPEPRPGAEEVSVDVGYAGVGFVDTLFRSGAVPLPLPLVPGIEVGGTVREVGPGVTDLAAGQRVVAVLNDFGRGPRASGYAEVALAHASMTTPVPDGVDLATATGAIVNGVTAWLALHEVARVAPRDTVVVLGAGGGLGSLAVRLAKLVGVHRVVGVVGHDVARVPDEADEAVLLKALADWLDADPAHAPDVVLDPVGGVARELLASRLAPFGRHVVLGNASGEDVAVSTDEVWMGSTVVAGLSVGGVAHLWPDRIGEASRAVLGLLAEGRLREPRPAVRPLEEAAAVHRALEERAAPAKTVLEL
jgi:NADPH:quinone reductase